jgi:ABC-type Fe3+ transport system permease subunit
MRIDSRRSGWPLTVGGACLLAGIFLLVLLLAGCAVGFGQPDVPGGPAPVVWGLDLGQAASGANDFFASVFEGIGGYLGLSGLGAGGVLVGGLVRAWAKRRTEAAAAEAQRLGERAGWDEAAADHAARTTARDAAFDEGVSRAAGGVGVARPGPTGPATGEVGA